MTNKHKQIEKPKRILRAPQKEEKEIDSIRLNKYLAKQGGFTRREADQLIRDGKITVNGKNVTELGIKINPNDEILFNGKKLSSGNHYYILLNKPKDTPTLNTNKKNVISVIDLVKKACPEQIMPVDILEEDETGLILLTNDDAVPEKIKNANGRKAVIYHLTLDKVISEKDLAAIKNAPPAFEATFNVSEISFVDDTDRTQLGIEIMNYDIQKLRQLFDKFGFCIKKLDRVYYAGLTKKGLQRGHWRHLKKTEIASLKMGSFK